MTQEISSRPDLAKVETAKVLSGTTSVTDNQPHTFTTTSEADAYAAAIDGGFVAVVQVAPDRYRRRVFLTLASAERCVRNARARGQAARIVLARLSPLYVLDGTAQPILPKAGERQ